ncbi:dual specificity protein phosphatase 14 [Cololabis saira]|uniref:dual specificity protein phosphatase 14 n=1 Tax=Cololabis saira TaxID=129043 RepID=UPI002AD1EC93|nr:dual specificity protein phosphatase 14 [Cololabis saira]
MPVSRVSQVRPGLLLSDLDSALDPSVLTSRNVTLVVNASGLDPPYPVLDPVLQVLPVPVQDRPHAPLSLYFLPVARRIQQNRTGSTLVHCSAGRSRSPALVMAYLMRSEGLSLRRAHELVLEARPFIRPNAGFWRQLLVLERELLGQNSVRMTQTEAGVLPEALPDPDRGGTDTGYCINV